MTLFAEPWGNYLLKDIVETNLPDSVSWWPSTIGWQLVLLLMVVFLIKKLYLAIKHYQQNAYRRDALYCLSKIVNGKNVEVCSNESNYRKLPALLRSTALHAFARNEISLLSGQSWEAWLDKQCHESNFSGKCSGLLDKLAYKTSFNITKNELTQLCAEIELWVKQHRSSND